MSQGAYRPPFPDQHDVLLAWLDEHAAETHTALPGRVESYDAAHQVADVLPLVRAPVLEADGETTTEPYPVLPCVPVIWPRTGAWFLSLPLAPGDTVLLVCCEAAIDRWRAGDGAPAEPGDLRRHHIAHAVCFPGLFVRSRALANASSSALVLGKDDGTRLTIGLDGSLSVTQGSAPVVEISAAGIVKLGGGALVPALDGVLTGRYQDPLTGAPAAPQASTTVLARKT